MNKNQNIIVINGKRYNARTGAELFQDVRAPQGQPVSPRTVKAAASPTQPLKARRPGQDVSRHKPHPSQTLMRRAVKKPRASLKRTVKVQVRFGFNDTSAAATINPKHLDIKQSPGGIRIDRSPLVNRFSQELFRTNHIEVVTAPAPVNKVDFSSRPHNHPKKPQTTAELLDIALQRATSHEQKPPKRRRRIHLRRSS